MVTRFAVIGCGRIGKRHAEQAMKVGNLKAVCDIDIARAQEFAADYECNAYSSLEDLLAAEKEIDVACICTPNGLHGEQSIDCLSAGTHVLCEKPMCLTPADGKRMLDASLAADRRLFVVKSARHNPLILQLKKLIDEDELGNIFSFQMNCTWNRPAAYYAGNWRGTTALDGGTLFTQFSHYIDILLWLFGDYHSMSGYRKNSHHAGTIEFEDTGAIALEMNSGALGTVHYSVNACDVNQEVSLTIVAEKGTVKLGGEYMQLLQYQQPAVLDLSHHAGTQPNDYGFYRGSMSNHDKVFEQVIKALRGEDNNVTDGADALKTVAFISDFYRQTKLG